ncbi:MAG: hypothetical protein ABSF81_01225 [Bacteroidales bacterium]
MRIIDAFWEKRNLGVNCKEIIIENNDTLISFSNIIGTIESTEYVVFKVPTGRFDFYEMLSKHGFVFIEGSINFKLNLKDAFLSPLQQRLNATISYSEMGQNDLEKLFGEIKNGIFATDRILLDNHFSKEQAANRYINWISDDLKRTAQVYKIIYKQNTIGFFTFKQTEEGIYYPFLVGLYKHYSSSGLGFTTLRKPIDEAIKRNGREISTYASTNNTIVVRSHIQQGFSMHDIQYIFVRHNKKIKE